VNPNTRTTPSFTHRTILRSMKISVRAKRRRLGATAAGFSVDEDEPDAEELQRPSLASPQLLVMDDVALSRQLQQQGVTLAEAERYNAALACFDDAVRRDPTSATAHEQRAQVLLELGRFFEAVVAAQHACDASPDWGDARLTSARAHLNLGEVALALASGEAAISLGCDSSEVVAEVAEIEEILLRCAIRADVAGETELDSGFYDAAALARVARMVAPPPAPPVPAAAPLDPGGHADC
jgi:tetratricopeptide (TPR) repeat protein